MTNVRVQEMSGAVEGTADGGPREVLVTLLRAGESLNGRVYPPQVLQEAVPLFEGATAFCDHGPAIAAQSESAAAGRSVRDVVGVYRAVGFADGRLQGVLRLVDGPGGVGRLVERVVRDRARGLPTPKVGLSADMVVVLAPREDGKTEVVQVLQVHSVDVVFNPAAGGAFERVLEAAQREQHGGTMDEADGREVGTMDETPARESSTLRQARLALCGDLLAARLAASGLPEAARHRLAQGFVDRIFEADELERSIQEMRELVGALTSQETIRGMGAGRVRVGLDMRDRLQWAVDRLLGLEIPDSVRESVPHPRGLRELFQAAGFDGQLGWEARRVREANEVTTSVMACIVGTSLNKRLVRDYAAQPKWWKPIAVEVAVRDMKQQERIRLNDFAGLSDVAENGAYTNLAWDDAKETYTPTKKGNIVYVTLETILNDDLRAVQSIPKKLARAAGVTINEFVAGLFTANLGEGPAMADSYRVFNATYHQGNLGSSALDSTSFGAAMAAIAKMTDTASKRMGLVGRWLLIPPDLEQTAFTLLYSQLKPGTANNDANFFQGRAQYIVVPQFTDTNNWYLLADPGQIELIEIGYLGGRDTPELLVQDDPSAGTVFTNDAISYKVRWVFGGGWLDYRGAYGAVVS